MSGMYEGSAGWAFSGSVTNRNSRARSLAGFIRVTGYRYCRYADEYGLSPEAAQASRFVDLVTCVKIGQIPLTQFFAQGTASDSGSMVSRASTLRESPTLRAPVS